MVKKIMKTGIAVLTVTSMFGLTVFAEDALPWNTNGGSTEVTGDAQPVEPTIEVELPGDLAFGINPLKLAVGEGDDAVTDQIVSGQYVITNYSNVPVLIKTETTLTGGDKVDILADAAYESNKDLKATDDKKSIWMVQLNPTAAAAADAEGNVTLTVEPLKFDGTDKNTTIKGKALGTTAAETLFKLEAADAEGAFKAASVSGFKFSGAVDPNSTFTEEDQIQVKTVFTLNTLSQNQIDNDYQTVQDYDDTVVEVKAAAGP